MAEPQGRARPDAAPGGVRAARRPAMRPPSTTMRRGRRPRPMPPRAGSRSSSSRAPTPWSPPRTARCFARASHRLPSPRRGAATCWRGSSVRSWPAARSPFVAAACGVAVHGAAGTAGGGPHRPGGRDRARHRRVPARGDREAPRRSSAVTLRRKPAPGVDRGRPRRRSGEPGRRPPRRAGHAGDRCREGQRVRARRGGGRPDPGRRWGRAPGRRHG